MAESAHAPCCSHRKGKVFNKRQDQPNWPAGQAYGVVKTMNALQELFENTFITAFSGRRQRGLEKRKM
jgi:hypothetical protein